MTARFALPPTTISVTPAGTFQPFQETRRYPTESSPGALETNRSLWIVRSSSYGEDLDYKKVAHDASPSDIEAAPFQLFPQALQLLIQGLAPGTPAVSPSLLQVTQSTGGHIWFLWSVPTATGPTFVGVIYDGTTFTPVTYGSTGAGEDTLGASISALDNGSVVVSYVLRVDAGGGTGGSVYYATLDPVSAPTTPGTFTRLGGNGYLLPSPYHLGGVLPVGLTYGGFAIAERPDFTWYMSWGAHDGVTTAWYATEATSISDLTSSPVIQVMTMDEVADLQESGVVHLLGTEHVWVGHNASEALLVPSRRGIAFWCEPLSLGLGNGPHVALVTRLLPALQGAFSVGSADACYSGLLGLFTGETAIFGAARPPLPDPCEEQEVLSLYTTGQSHYHRGTVPWKGNTYERCPEG